MSCRRYLSQINHTLQDICLIKSKLLSQEHAYETRLNQVNKEINDLNDTMRTLDMAKGNYELCKRFFDKKVKNQFAKVKGMRETEGILELIQKIRIVKELLVLAKVECYHSEDIDV